MSEQFNQVWQGYRARISDDKISFHPYIPQKKLKNAIEGYASNESESDVIVLIDNTFFGNAKDGLLLTSNTLHIHNMMESAQHIDLKDIESVDFKEGVMDSALIINGSFIFRSNMPSRSSIALFAEMLREITKTFHCEILEEFPMPGIADSLKSLKMLFEDGLLTESEYEQKRKVLIAQL
ncbi:SHOCT domain-containing protein [Undibacterium sp. WLX3042]|jgi:hypothetical protein|uniref:SHOCT domain-containing protein n=1 Tax=Undibacterium sp. WLX3042 TaxID=3412686 RepID=UPI003C2D04C0